MRLGLAASLIGVGLVFAAPAGAVPWRDLHRPLDLPELRPGGSCPVSRVDDRVDWEEVNIFGGSGIGRGPVYAGLGGEAAADFLVEPARRGGYGNKLFWYVAPRYRDRVLIRGRGLDGEGAVSFSDGDNRADPGELRINRGEGTATGWPGKPRGSRGEASGVFVPGPGCFAVQVDGATFSRSIVFTASVD